METDKEILLLAAKAVLDLRFMQAAAIVAINPTGKGRVSCEAYMEQLGEIEKRLRAMAKEG